MRTCMTGAVRGLASSLFVVLSWLVVACDEPPPDAVRADDRTPPVATAPAASRGAESASGAAASGELPPPAAIGPGECDAPLPIFGGGEQRGEICARDLDARGLTAVELGAAFAPHIFDEAPELGELGEQPYRAVYVALADHRWDALPREVDREPDLELFGIFPTFRVLAARLADDARHACHEAVDDAALGAMEGTLRAWTDSLDAQRARLRWLAYAELVLGRERESRGVASIVALEGVTERPLTLRRWARDRARVDAVRALQAHLRCDALLDARAEDGVFDARTARALAQYQRRHVIVASGQLDAATRARLAADSRESDFLAVLRALRERVADATGVIEDGSARGEWGTVLGRTLDAPEMRSLAGHEPLPNGAPDLVSRATEEAARALGWISPEAFLERTREAPPERVAIALPPPPRYHARHVELRAEIDRGDVWYAYPYTADGRHRAQPVRARPVLTLYARDGEREVAVVRWPTTIGGWKPERAPDGSVGLRYKESPVGPRIWRDVVASPAWLPPDSTPADELVRFVPGRGWVPETELFGPGYRSAYGLVMMMHHRPITRRDGETIFFDEGVRAHGSVSYGSILRGTSHGCHRLYNHFAVRLGGFLLAHRDHVRHGSIPVRYQRDVHVEGGTVPLRIRSRGVRYELTPPVPVEVLEGNVRGGVREPSRGFRPLRGALLEAAQAAATADEGM